jgi:hypothetical protein
MVLDEAKEEKSLPSVPKNVEVEILEERLEEVKRPSGRVLEEAAVGEEQLFGEQRPTRPGRSHCRSSKNHRRVAPVACSASGSLECCEPDAPEDCRQTGVSLQSLPRSRFLRVQ